LISGTEAQVRTADEVAASKVAAGARMVLIEKLVVVTDRRVRDRMASPVEVAMQVSGRAMVLLVIVVVALSALLVD
jgi:hypothetical protein